VGTRELFELMARQHGVASRAQGRALGVSSAVEQRLMIGGALVPLLPGIVAAGGAALTFSAQAMAATLRPGVVAVSHGAAARLHGLAGFAGHRRVDVIGRRGAHIRLHPPFLPHYTRGPIDGHVVRLGAIPVTSIPLTLVLIASDLSRARVSAVLADVLSGGVPGAAIRAVAGEWRSAGRSGPGRVLELLDGVSGGAVSAVR
jgi:hypothetical protein